MDYIDFNINYTDDELYEYEKTYLLRKHLSIYKGIPGIIILVVFAYFAILAYQNGLQSVNKIAVIVFGVLVLAFLIVILRIITLRLTYKKRYVGSEILEKSVRIVLSINGVYPDNLEETPVYEKALDFFESKQLFVVEVGDEKGRRALIVPKRYCSNEKTREFVRDCATRMIENAKPKKTRKK